MNTSTVATLLQINQTFYESFGAEFAATRRRIQPGIRHFLDTIAYNGNWFDLGCGSGALGTAWAEKGLKGSYIGLDFSHALLQEAQTNTAPLSSESFFIDYAHSDLLSPHWDEILPLSQYDGAVCFAALHHIPSRKKQKAIFKIAASRLKPGGLFVYSVWQFQHSPKLMARVLPWSTVGIDQNDVETGDTLLDWRFALPDKIEEQRGLRYVHLFTPESLRELAESEQFTVIDEFRADGKEGNLALYHVAKK